MSDDTTISGWIHPGQPGDSAQCRWTHLKRGRNSLNPSSRPSLQGWRICRLQSFFILKLQVCGGWYLLVIVPGVLSHDLRKKLVEVPCGSGLFLTIASSSWWSTRPCSTGVSAAMCWWHVTFAISSSTAPRDQHLGLSTWSSLRPFDKHR